MVWISMQICKKPCWSSKNGWETLGYSILLMKLRPRDSPLQTPGHSSKCKPLIVWIDRRDRQIIRGPWLQPRPAASV